MPHQSSLKLCLACDQVSPVRTTTRVLRCKQPFAGGTCGSRRVRALSFAEFNTTRALDKATYEGRIGDLEARVEQLEGLAVVVQDLQRQLHERDMRDRFGGAYGRG